MNAILIAVVGLCAAGLALGLPISSEAQRPSHIDDGAFVVSPAQALSGVDSLRILRRELVERAFLGDADGMTRVAESRDRALDLLDRAVRTPRVIGQLPWPARRHWLALALAERRPAWTRALLEGLEGELPPEGSPSRGSVALAVAFSAMRLLETDPEDENAFIRGGANSALTEIVEQSLRVAAAEPFLLQDEAIYHLWRLAEADGETAQARAWADSLVANHLRSLRTPEVRLTRARSLLERGAFGPAIEEARLASPSVDTPELRRFLADAFLQMDFPREAARELEYLVSKFGTDRQAVAALRQRLDLADANSDLYLTLQERIPLFKSLLPQPGSGAVEWMRSIADGAEISDDLRETAALHLCLYLYRAKRYSEAEPYLQRLTGSTTEKTAREARLYLARIYRNTGRIEKMEPHYRWLMEKPGTTGARGSWELGREYESLGRWEAADSAFTDLVVRFPGDRRYRDGIFRRGFVRFRLGLLEAAVEDFRTAFRASKAAIDEEQAAFWLAHVLRLLNRESEARLAAQAGAARSEPADYYGFLLRRRFDLPSKNPPRPASAPFSAADPLAFLGEDSAWPQPVVRHYVRGLALAELGQAGAARKEWARAAEYGKRLASVFQALSISTAAHNVYPEGVRWANRAIALLPSGHEFTPGFKRLAYPPAYYGDVRAAGTINGIDPTHLWALIRQESLYDPLAVSRADARGLMQILPATLNRMTMLWGLPGMSPEALFQPRINIVLGTRFLAERLQEFENRLLPTLASYNAGEGKSWQWLDLSEGDADEVFVECIGYPETHTYVRRIPWLIWVYGAYYTGNSETSDSGSDAR